MHFTYSYTDSSSLILCGLSLFPLRFLKEKQIVILHLECFYFLDQKLFQLVTFKAFKPTILSNCLSAFNDNGSNVFAHVKDFSV